MTELEGAKNTTPTSEYLQYCRESTKHLRHARPGTRLQNIVSKNIGVATERIDRNHPFVFVEYVQRKGKHKGKRVWTPWWVEHVRIVK